MLEVEVKYRIDNANDIRRKLNSLGASLVETVIERDYYFQHPCRDFKATDEALRIRLSKNKCTLTYKGPRISGKAKVREELSVELANFKSISAILSRLGFKPIALVVKKREIYSYKDFKISIDEVTDLGTFIEIEYTGQVGQENYNQALENIKQLIKELGISGPCILKSYLELILEKLAKTDIEL